MTDHAVVYDNNMLRDISKGEIHRNLDFSSGNRITVDYYDGKIINKYNAYSYKTETNISSLVLDVKMNNI